jgi:hypothetical protein
MPLEYFHKKPSNGIMNFIINEIPELPPSQDWCVARRLCCNKLNSLKTAATIKIKSFKLTAKQIPTDDFIQIKLPTRAIPTSVGNMQCINSETIVNVKVTGWATLSNDGVGTLVLTGKHPCGNASITLNAIIRGKNPSKPVISAALQTDVLRAICWQESNWRQFDSQGLPIQNNNVDWGIMQINGAPPELRWHWRNNIERGRAILDEKRTHATAYLNKHPPYTNEMLENEMLQRYNGGAYYKWSTTNLQWEVSPPNDYVRRIKKHIENKPWT